VAAIKAPTRSAARPRPAPHAYVPNPTFRIDPLGLAPCEPDVHLVLGLSHIDDNYHAVHEFAEKVNGHSYWDLPDEWTGHGIHRTILRILRHPKAKISVNLTGVDSPYAAYLRVVRNGGHVEIGDREVSFMDWELYQISWHPEAWPRITFYRDGKVVGNPFKSSGGVLEHPFV
jgi:hypothetical protein